MENILIYLSSLPLSLSFLNAWYVVCVCVWEGEQMGNIKIKII